MIQKTTSNTKYLTALILTVSVCLFAYLITSEFIKSNNLYSEIINKSGRQRMLTQKISKLILLINYSNNQKQNEILKKELKENLNLMTDTHKRLSGEIANDRLSKKNSEKVKNIYLNLETNNLSQEFFDLSQKFIDSKITQNEILYLTQDLNTNLLKKLDLVVSQYQKDSEEEIKKLLLIMQVVSLILVIFAAWEVIVVFN